MAVAQEIEFVICDNEVDLQDPLACENVGDSEAVADEDDFTSKLQLHDGDDEGWIEMKAIHPELHEIEHANDTDSSDERPYSVSSNPEV